MMLVTLASVVMGVTVIAPGIGVPLGIVLLIVWVRTSAVARWRVTHGIAVPRKERVHLFVASLGTTFALIATLGVAGFAAFLAACFACAGTYFGLEAFGDDFALATGYIVCGIVVLAIAIPTFRYVFRIVRRRWKQDTQQMASDLPTPPKTHAEVPGGVSIKKLPVAVIVLLCLLACGLIFFLAILIANSL